MTLQQTNNENDNYTTYVQSGERKNALFLII